MGKQVKVRQAGRVAQFRRLSAVQDMLGTTRWGLLVIRSSLARLGAGNDAWVCVVPEGRRHLGHHRLVPESVDGRHQWRVGSN